jgi:signal transduction histidine kinase
MCESQQGRGRGDNNHPFTAKFKMKKLKLLILIFSLALSIPLAYFVLKTYRGLEQEETATLSYFAETLFDEMERALAVIVQREEGRAVDEYNFHVVPSRQTAEGRRAEPSPLSRAPGEDFILGYFQNNPDGSFQTPLVEDGSSVPAGLYQQVTDLKNANEIFNRKRVTDTDRIIPRPAEVLAVKDTPQQAGFADKYLDISRTQPPRDYLGQKGKRVEKITVDQAANIAGHEQPQLMSSAPAAEKAGELKEERAPAPVRAAGKAAVSSRDQAPRSYRVEAESSIQSAASEESDEAASYQVELAPLQAVFLSDSQVFIFRRIMINKQIYRQGFVLQVPAFLNYLARTHFLRQPMAQFSGLRLSVMDQGREARAVEVGAVSPSPDFILNRSFPSPFSFLKATLTCSQIPRSAGRSTLTIMLAVLAVIVLMGLFAIYQSTRAIVELSERRSQFVSSVTHELKTPLTNIRMYIEMLEQGIALTPEREQEYFRILDSEGARLSRLINNVLEMSKLEKKQRHIDLQTGNFADVIHEVQAVMAERIKQEGFILTVEAAKIRPFKYDREVMIQVLINLIENSMKFGKSGVGREIGIRTHQAGDRVQIMVTDTGPGIPRHALKKVFDDFYRVENSLTRTTRGTGIGLALVKKFVRLMGGSVAAANNDGPGCTITVTLPG